MKREDLEKIEGLSKEAIDKIMQLHGQDIESHKTKLTTAQAEIDGLKKQITDANAQIESFKGMNIDQIKASAEEWKTKAEQAAADAQKQVAQLKFDHALDGALSGAKAKNAKAVRALLNTELLKLGEDGTISGLKEQLEKIQSEADYLFESEGGDPKVITKTNGNTNLNTDPVTTAMRRAAGLKVE